MLSTATVIMVVCCKTPRTSSVWAISFCLVFSINILVSHFLLLQQNYFLFFFAMMKLDGSNVFEIFISKEVILNIAKASDY